MARPLRLDFPGALWHVTNRGVEKRDIFLTREQRLYFLALLAEVVVEFDLKLYAFVLMTNHFHLLVRSMSGQISRAMQKLEGRYADFFNESYDRSGHLFEGRFVGKLIQSERYFLTVARYVVLNPVRAFMVGDPFEWEWSSLAASTGRADCSPWLSLDILLESFDRNDRSSAFTLCEKFVREGIGAPSPWKDIRRRMFLGDAQFEASCRRSARIASLRQRRLK